MSTYRERLSEGIIEAIMRAGMSEDGKVTHIMSGEIVDELVSCIAFVSHTSDACSSPSATRKFCDDWARKLQRRIAAAKAQVPAGLVQTIHLGEEN